MADLNLTGGKGDGGLRLDAEPAVNPSAVNAINAPIQAAPLLDFQNNLGGSIANVIGAAGSGLLGDTQFAARKRKQNQIGAQLKRDNLMKGSEFARTLLKGGQGLTGAQREKYRESGAAAIASLNIPELSSMFEANFDQPDLATAFTEEVDKTQIIQNLLKLDPTGKSALKFKTSKEGRLLTEQVADDTYLGPAQQKVSGITSTLDALVRNKDIDPKLLEKVMKDGKISVPEIKELSNSIPEGHPLRMTPEELSTVTSSRNTDALRSMGISLAEDFEPEDLKASGKTIMDSEGNVSGTLVTTASGGNMVQPPGGGALRPLVEGEFVTTIGDTAEGAGIGKKTTSKLEDTIISTTSTLDNLDGSIRDFDRQFLTIGGRAKFAALDAASKAGIPLNNTSKEFLANFASFKAGTLTTLNEEIKRITGAAVTKDEANKRIIPSMPNASDSPDVYLAKMETVRERLQIVKLRAGMALEQGLKKAFDIPWAQVVSQIEDGSLPQKRMDALTAEGLSDEEAFAKVESEFPTSMLEKAMNQGQ